MKTTFKLLAVFAWVLLGLGQPTPVSAEDDNKELFITSSFETYDPSGCIYTQVFVDLVKMDGPVATVYIYRDDLCTGVRLINAYGYTELERSEYQVAGNLDSATVNTTVSLFDWVSQSSFDVHVDVSWTATSPVSRYVGNSMQRGSYGPGMCHWIDNEAYHKRDAQASGTVSAGETNFTPGASIAAAFFLGKYVSISACQPMFEARLREQLQLAPDRLQRFKYSGVYTFFSQVDPSGCVVTYLEVSGGNFLVDSGSKLSGAAFYLSKYDRCRSVLLGSASNDFVPVTNSELKISGNSATLKKTATLYDSAQGESIDVFVDVTWATAGPMYQNVYSFQWHAPDCDEHGHETWGWRFGKAWGTILSSEITLTSTPAQYAEFNWDRYVVDWCE